MANSKISALTSATTPLAGTETLPIVQNSTTKQVSVTNLTAGRTQTSNGIVQGTAATGYNFTANTPAAGMTSQLLNWYEEGNWTPTLTGSSTNPTVTYSLQRARYTRIGRLVTVESYLAWSAFSGGSGDVYISGLPFTIDSSTGAYGAGSISQLDGITYAAARTSPGLMALAGTTSLRFMCFGSAVASATIPTTSVAASGNVVFTCTYSV